MILLPLNNKGRSLARRTASDTSVRDLRQQAVIGGGIIRIRSFVGRQRVAEYAIPLEEWQAAARGPTANPNWNQLALVRNYTAALDEQPGGLARAARIRDSQLRAIRKALALNG